MTDRPGPLLGDLAARVSPCLHRGKGRTPCTMAKPSTSKKKSTSTKPLSKGATIEAIADAVGDGISKKHVALVVDTLAAVGHRELKKTGTFVVPGFGKFVVVKKPARPAREGINPFTKEKQKFAAKPASKSVKARPAKAIKDAVA